jgi:nucleotide-binding universal stress UspA family protein
VGSTAAQMCRYAPVSVLAARRGADLSPHSPVLCATDFSASAGVALARADDEALARGVPLALVHALDIGHPALAAFDASAVLPRTAIDGLHAACREMLESARSSLRSKGPYVVADGPPGPAVAHAARELQAQLVVVGTHGRSDLRHLALGSATEAILHKTSCSVLVVRPE